MKSRSVAILLAIVFCLLFPFSSFSKDKIRIGQAISLSGPLAEGAAVCEPYWDLWVKDVNAAGGIYVKEYGKKLPIEFIKYDDKSDIGTMTKLLEKLIIDDKVDFIFPPWGTAFLYAAAPIANKHGYILIGGAGGAEKLKELKLPYFFQCLNFSETQMPVLAEILSELGIKKVAVFFFADLHGIEYSGRAVPEFAHKGIDVVMVKSFPPGIKDFSPLLKEAKAKAAEGLFLACYPGEGILAAKQASELGIDFDAFFVSVGPGFTFFKDVLGPEAVEGIMGGGAWNEKSGPGAKWLSDHFKQVFRTENPNYWGGLYFYASLQHFQKAIEKAGTLNQKKIRDTLAKERFDTVLGPYWYDERQIFVNHPGEIGQWQGGTFEVVDPGPKRTAKPKIKPPWPKKR